MNKEEQSVRKQWLGVLVWSMGLSITNVVLQFRNDPLLEGMDWRLRVGAAALPILSALAFGWIAFHCAYRKPGTKFLMFILILSGCGFVSTPIFYFSGHLPAPPYIPYFGTYLLLTQAIGIYWTFLSWKMRKINKRLKGLAAESQA